MEKTPEEVTIEIISQYLSLPEPTHQTVGLNRIYKGLLSSAQNSNMKSTVIGKSINGFDNLSRILHDFNPSKTLSEFSNDPNNLLDRIKSELEPNGKIRETNRSIWPQYCRTILSAAKFLVQFRDSKEFLDWVDCFYNNKNTLPALPMIISEEVHGLGFPLACDFLKDIGYSKFGKPDVHIKQIFEATSLVSQKPSDYQTLNAIMRISSNVNEEAYKVDKIFWLIGSGKFYLHEQIGNKGRIGSLKKNFIRHIASREYLI